LGLASLTSIAQHCSLPEFCWINWLAGLVYTWVCILTATLQIILKSRSEKPVYDRYLPFLQRLSPGIVILGVTAVSMGAMLLACRLSIFLFGFYKLFLSVFAERVARTA
jgi:hypothetical protein